jgi:hypothetical protein
MLDPKSPQRDVDNADAGFPPLHEIDPAEPVEPEDGVEGDYHEDGGGD